MARELNVLALLKGKDRYIFVYDDGSLEQLLDVFQDQAADPEMSFTWFDAAVLGNKAREQASRHDCQAPASRSRLS